MDCWAFWARARISANEPFFGGAPRAAGGALEGPGDGLLGAAGLDILLPPFMGLEDKTLGLAAPFVELEGLWEGVGLSEGRDGRLGLEDVMGD